MKIIYISLERGMPSVGIILDNPKPPVFPRPAFRRGQTEQRQERAQGYDDEKRIVPHTHCRTYTDLAGLRRQHMILADKILDFLQTDGLWYSAAGLSFAFDDAPLDIVQSALDELTARGLVNHDNQNPPWYYALPIEYAEF